MFSRLDKFVSLLWDLYIKSRQLFMAHITFFACDIDIYIFIK